jgi:Flp pilus assembly protein TadB
VNRRRDLIVANVAVMLLLFVVLLLGWWQEAAFGLAVLLLLNLFVVLRGRQARYDRGAEGEDEGQASSGGVEDE